MDSLDVENTSEDKLSWKKILLIVLTVCILGPIVFVGSCFPLGYLGFGLSFENSGIEEFFGTCLLFGGWVIGIGLAIFVCYKVIKRIINHRRNAPSTN